MPTPKAAVFPLKNRKAFREFCNFFDCYFRVKKVLVFCRLQPIKP